MSIGHEAHCPFRPYQPEGAECDCVYPELEALRQEVIDRQGTEDSLLEWNDKLAAENSALRKMLWLHHGCPLSTLYGDDGEMQCNNRSCMIDFKRHPVDTIRRLWIMHAEKMIDEAGGMSAVLEMIKNEDF